MALVIVAVLSIIGTLGMMAILSIIGTPGMMAILTHLVVFLEREEIGQIHIKTPLHIQERFQRGKLKACMIGKLT